MRDLAFIAALFAVTAITVSAGAETIYTHKTSLRSNLCGETKLVLGDSNCRCRDATDTVGDECTTDEYVILLSTGGVASQKNTGWIDVSAYDSVVFGAYVVDFVVGGSMTELTWSCEASNDTSVALGSGFDICSAATSAGTTTYTCPWVGTYDPDNGQGVTITLSNLPLDYINCTFYGETMQVPDRYSISVQKRITP